MMEWLDVTPSAGINRSDWNEGEFQIVFDCQGYHIHFEFKTGFFVFQHQRHQPVIDQPVTGLIIRDVSPHGQAECDPAECIGQPANERHLGKIPFADD